MNIEDLAVEIRNAALIRIAQVPEEILDLKATWGPRGTGTWELVLPVGSEHADMLRVPGSGLIVSYKGKEVLSGPTTKPEIAYTTKDVAGSITFNGVSDSIHLYDRLCYPQPSNPDVSTQTVADWVMTAPAETIMHQIVCTNLGTGAPDERRLDNFSLGHDSEAGDTIAVKLRWSGLAATLNKIAIAHRINYHIIQRSDQLVFETRTAGRREDDVRLSVANGSLSSFKVSYAPPEVTHAIVGGRGSGSNRIFKEFTTPDSEAGSDLWDRRIEKYIDQAGAEDDSALKTAALKELNSKGGTAVTSQAIPLEGDQLNFINDWQVGDFVTADIEGQELSAEVSGGVLDASDSKVALGITLGNPLGFDLLAKRVYETNDQNISFETVQLQSEVPVEMIEQTATTVDEHTTTLETHTTEIETHTTEIADNTSSIETNTTDIATNTSDIAALQGAVDDIASDGFPPTDSPDLTLEPFAVGALQWKVDPTWTNPDQAHFRVYAGTVSSPPIEDPSCLVYEGTSRSGVFGAIAGVNILPDDPLVSPEDYIVVCVAYDVDGPAPLGNQSDPASPTRATAREISAEWIYVNTIQANQIEAGSILTQLLNIGAFVALDGETSSITIYADEDHNEPLIQLRPDGSVFRAQLVSVDHLEVLESLKIQGDQSVLSQAAVLILESAVSDPITKPTLSLSLPQQKWPSVPSGWTTRGICWDPDFNCWTRLLIRSPFVAGDQKIERITWSGSDWDIASSVTLNVPGTTEDTVSGILRLGSSYYMNYLDSTGTSTGWYLSKWSTSGVFQASIKIGPASDTRPSVGTDGTNVLVGRPDVNKVDSYNAAITSQIGSWSGTIPTGHSGFVGKGNFDFGANRVVIVSDKTMYSYTLSGATLTEQASERVTLAGTALGGGMDWDGSQFCSTHGASALYLYDSRYASAGERVYVAYTDTDGTNHTKASPIGSIALRSRWCVTVALPAAPESASIPNIYALIDTTAPAVTDLLDRSESVSNRSSRIVPSTTPGSALGTDSNSFGGGTPAIIKTQAGGYELRGDGAGTWPLLGHSDQKSLSSSASVSSTSNVNLTSLNMTINSSSLSDVFWVKLDATVGITTAGTYNLIELLVDGATESAVLGTSLTGATGRVSGHKEWRITGLAPGSHTIAFRTSNSASSTGATIYSGYTMAAYWTSA